LFPVTITHSKRKGRTVAPKQERKFSLMSTRAQQAKTIRDPNVLDQLAGSLIASAADVLNEPIILLNHPQRLAFANYIFAAPLAAASLVAPALLTNPTLATQAGGAAGSSGTPFADADVDYVVGSLFDVYADRLMNATTPQE
jgi:hypothetical protein